MRWAVVEVYSTYEAKAKFSEVLRKVRAGKRVIVSHRGEHVAEIVPLRPQDSPEKRLRDMQERGIISRYREPVGDLRPVARRPGALKRFLESRD